MDSASSRVARGSSAYLQDCLNKQAAVAMALYGQRQDLERIQKRASQLAPRDTLTYGHIEQITDLKLWAGQQFWQWPTRTEFNERLRDYPVRDLWNVKGREKEVIGQLLNLFRHIEPVSVVLRFLHPKHFGILSPPVEKLLELRASSSPTEKYLNYISDLRDIRDYCNRMKYCEFSTAAEVDMAIWTLQEVMEASRADSTWLDQVVPEHRQWCREL